MSKQTGRLAYCSGCGNEYNYDDHPELYKRVVRTKKPHKRLAALVKLFERDICPPISPEMLRAALSKLDVVDFQVLEDVVKHYGVTQYSKGCVDTHKCNERLTLTLEQQKTNERKHYWHRPAHTFDNENR